MTESLPDEASGSRTQTARLRTLVAQRNRTILKLTARLRPLQDRVRELEAEAAGLRRQLAEAARRENELRRTMGRADSERGEAEQALHLSYEELEGLAVQVEEQNSQLLAANARIAQILRDNQALLAEVHHRVRNNFQAIVSSIRLKLRRADPAARAPLIDVLGRIHAMALVHELLFGEGAPSTVQPGRYLSSLCRRLADLARADLLVSVEADDIEPVDPETALSMGTIVTELVVNALKHAFPEDRPGTVSVALRGRGIWDEIIVHDDGIGLSAGRCDSRAGVGLVLVRKMAWQIGADVTIEEGNGTTVSICRQGGRNHGLASPAQHRPNGDRRPPRRE
ncbi:sensor histidine kinase [Arenibaculum pallidiluteum]|uniref:sensor histidine kinase n=1 Tax=Arenibaculum pallidiluteum TaxID=2812559 RepID=UPI001A96674A|nr:sensor histidine kinase [Arenibaculum pallidiluteum]